MRIYAGTRLYRTLVHPRGMVLITAMWIAIALAAVVLVLGREMVVESMTARQHLDQAKADAAEQGMEQFVCSVLEQEVITPGYKDHTDWEMRKIGDCYCWVMTYNPDDETIPKFGLTDEGGKIDLNTASNDMEAMLPNLDQYQEFVDEVQNWVNPDTDPTNEDGQPAIETPDYEAAVNYHAKNAPFESVDELRLLLSMQDAQDAEFILHGADTNHNHVLDQSESDNMSASMSFESEFMVGIEPFVTVYGLRATPLAIANAPTSNSATTGSTISGGINSNNNSTSSSDITIADVNASQNGSAALSNALATTAIGQSRATTIANATFPQGGGGGRGGAATTTTYKNIWDWANQMTTKAQLTPQEFSEIYMNVTCSFPPVSTSSTATQTSTIATGTSTAPATQPTTPVGRVNVWTAPKAVLMCLPSFTEDDADAIITYRESNFESIYSSDPTQLPDIAWLMDPNQVNIEPQTLVDAGCYLTGVSNVYSADIVTVSPDGRAFKRVKIVVDVTSGTPQIIYRRDNTKEGWPLDPSVRQMLKDGRSDDIQRIGPIPTGR